MIPIVYFLLKNIIIICIIYGYGRNNMYKSQQKISSQLYDGVYSVGKGTYDISAAVTKGTLNTVGALIYTAYQGTSLVTTGIAKFAYKSSVAFYEATVYLWEGFYQSTSDAIEAISTSITNVKDYIFDNKIDDTVEDSSVALSEGDVMQISDPSVDDTTYVENSISVL